MNNERITVLLPAFNEEENIAEVIADIKKAHPDFEVLVVDDGSTDQTRRVAEEAGAIVHRHPHNIGNGAAIKTGLRNASGDWVVMMDADGQHNPAEIAKLIVYKNDYEMVVGARTNASKTSMPRNLANGLFNLLASYVTKFKIQDLTSGFRVVRTKTARKYIYLLPNTFSYPSTITMAFLKTGRSVKYVPINTRTRKGKSKIKPTSDGVRFLLIITKIATLFSPMRIFLPVSFTFFLGGILYYLHTFINEHRFSNMSALLLTSSVIIFMMGLISEQISQMRYDKTEEEC